MAFINTDIEMIVSIFWEAVYPVRYELISALIFIFGMHLGRLRNRRKNGLKPAYQKVEKVPSRPQSSKGGQKIDGQAFHGRLDKIKPALIKDPSWVVPQVTQLCRIHDHTGYKNIEAFRLYRAAIQAGLKLEEVPTNECQQLFMSMVTAAIRANQLDEVEQFFRELRTSGIGVSIELFASVVKLCTSKQLFAGCVALHDCAKEDLKFVITDKSVWSCLLFCAIESKNYQKSVVFIRGLKACGAPSPQDFSNMLRFAARNGDWATSLSLIQEMRDENVEIFNVQYNTALATCVDASKIVEAHTLLSSMEDMGPGIADIITYNTVMKGFAKAGRIEECFELFERLQAKGMTPSQVTYGILLDGCINENQVDRAMKIFNDMTKEGCQLNTILCTMLIKGFVRAGRTEQAMNVYRQMRDERHNNTAPDIITFSTLIKANCDTNQMEEALKLLGDMVDLRLKPDEVIFNNLMAGCGRQGNAKLGQQLYADMIASGIPPSNATFSILIRMYHQCKLLEEAVTMLRVEPAKYKVKPEIRLFLQLIQTCMRARHGRRAIEVYEMLCENTIPSAATNASLLTTCMSVNFFETAAEIVRIAVLNGSPVEAGDINMVAEAAFKKSKANIVQRCVASLLALGYVVDPKFQV